VGEEGESGFTLIEMMIVVAIIAILVGMLVPNFVRARAQAQTAACEANLKEIATALELYESDHDAYPSGSAVPVNANNADLQPYLKQIPVDPAAGPKAYYEYTVTQAGARRRVTRSSAPACTTRARSRRFAGHD